MATSWRRFPRLISIISSWKLHCSSSTTWLRNRSKTHAGCTCSGDSTQKFWKVTPLGNTGDQKNQHEEKSDAKYFQDIFDPWSLIRMANKLQRLVKTLSFPIEGIVYVYDIYDHCDE